MTLFGIALTATAVVCGFSAITFCSLYAQTRRGKQRPWYMTEMGRNIMGLAASIAVLCSGTVLRRIFPGNNSGELILLVGYGLVAIVMVWRTTIMWRANNPPQTKGR